MAFLFLLIKSCKTWIFKIKISLWKLYSSNSKHSNSNKSKWLNYRCKTSKLLMKVCNRKQLVTERLRKKEIERVN